MIILNALSGLITLLESFSSLKWIYEKFFIDIIAGIYKNTVLRIVGTFYRAAPKSLGGWASTPDAEICGYLTNVEVYFWTKNLILCQDTIEKHIHSWGIILVYTLGSIFFVAAIKKGLFAKEIEKKENRIVDESPEKTGRKKKSDEEKAATAARTRQTKDKNAYNAQMTDIFKKLLDSLQYKENQNKTVHEFFANYIEEVVELNKSYDYKDKKLLKLLE